MFHSVKNVIKERSVICFHQLNLLLDFQWFQTMYFHILDILPHFRKEDLYSLFTLTKLLCPKSHRECFDTTQHSRYYPFAEQFHLWIYRPRVIGRK